jgi:hypothetical protein
MAPPPLLTKSLINLGIYSGPWMDNTAGKSHRLSVEARECQSSDWRSRAGRKACKQFEFTYRTTVYFVAGGGVTTAVIFRIMPSDLLKT